MQIINAWICQISENTILPIFGDIEIEEHKIVSINEKEFNLSKLDKTRADETIDAQGRVLTIPNVNYHDHIYSRLAKGLDIKGDMSNFPNILKNLWWKLDSLLDLDMISASAQMAAIESIKCGVTYIVDHHSSPNCAKDSLKTISEELEKFRIRSVLCFETTDRNGQDLTVKGFEENHNYFKQHTSVNSKSLLGLHASFTLDDDSLIKASQLVKENNWGVHVHLCEDMSDPLISEKKYSNRPVQRFTKYGLLSKKSIVAHGIHLDAEEFELIKKSGAALVFNIDSNMNNSVGLQKYKLIPKEIPILVGTDGMHSNIARSFKELFLQIRHAGFTFDEAFDFIIKSYFAQLKFIKQYFTDFTSLQIGDRADFIIWDYVPPTPINKNNYWGHYLYGILERQVTTVVQNGNLLLANGEIKNINEQKIMQQIYTEGKKLSVNFNKE